MKKLISLLWILLAINSGFAQTVNIDQLIQSILSEKDENKTIEYS